MPDPSPAPDVALPPRQFSPGAAVLSYLVPGLGQIAQGRVGKGVLFMVCLLGLFFYGQHLGGWRNVYIEVDKPLPKGATRNYVVTLVDKVRFFGQVWIGAAAWPAIVQFATTQQAVGIDREGRPIDQNGNLVTDQHPVLGKFQRMPPENELNAYFQGEDKKPDLGWTYTVIAGVLNILVIYDALAGPAFVTKTQAPRPERTPETVPST